MRHPELGLHYVSGALRHGLGQPGLHGIQPRADDAPAAAPGGRRAGAQRPWHFDPLMWVIENPATGLLKTRPFMERLPWVDVTYCKYGTPYRKQTRLWTNMRWRPRRSLCRPGSRCEAWQDGRHLRAAQRGPRLMEGQYERVSQSRELLYSVPAALREEIARAATEELAERLSIPD